MLPEKLNVQHVAVSSFCSFSICSHTEIYLDRYYFDIFDFCGHTAAVFGVCGCTRAAHGSVSAGVRSTLKVSYTSEVSFGSFWRVRSWADGYFWRMFLRMRCVCDLWTWPLRSGRGLCKHSGSALSYARKPDANVTPQRRLCSGDNGSALGKPRLLLESEEF